MLNKLSFYSILFILSIQAKSGLAQASLPNITVKDYNGKIVVSWKNDYAKPISNISIQRSFDSLRNFTTIGTVLNPQNLENGFADDKAPFNGMYYRLFISFEGGNYEFSKTQRPERVPLANEEVNGNSYGIRYFWQLEPVAEASPDSSKAEKEITTIPPSLVKPDSVVIPNKPAPESITYPSKRIYTVRESSLVLFLPGASHRKYHVRFFDESDKPVLELHKLTDEYLILEKYNFMKSGWYHFELYDADKLIEKNKFFLGKDAKTNISIPRLNNR